MMNGRTKDVLVVFIGALLILAPALVNGFPFVYPDSGTYVRSAFQGYVPIDRPFWYGIFMRITSLGGHTFWGIVMGQALLCSTYILRTIKLFVAPKRLHLISLFVFAALAGLSSVGYYAGVLIPDIFTAIGILAIIHFLIDRKGWAVLIGDATVVLICCWVHLSNMLIIPLCGALLLLLLRKALQPEVLLRWIRIGAITLLAWTGLGLGNLAVDGSFYLSRGGHVFLVARFLDAGILRPWLQEHCIAGDEYRLCKYVDELPSTSTQFLWSDSISPMHREGGWLATREEYDRVVREVLTEPAYLGIFLREGVRSTGQLLTGSSVFGGLVNMDYRRTGSPPYVMISNTIPEAMPAYLGSLQNGGRGELDMFVMDRINVNVLSILVLVMAILLVVGGGSGDVFGIRPLLLFALGAVIINCTICATLSVVEDRYFSRVSWLLLLFTIAAIMGRFFSGRSGAGPSA